MHLKNNDPLDELKDLENIDKNDRKSSRGGIIPKNILEKFSKMKKIKNVQKSTGYVRLACNYGNLNVELYCNKTPKTCYNFMCLCERGEYDGIKFHRLIKEFMIQGGRTKNNESCWGGHFEDELCEELKHVERGVVSMANKGEKTNGSQFFICLKESPWLDMKHTVFGKVVGGLNLLDIIENFETDEKDKPLKDIIIRKAIVYNNPFHQL